MNIALIIGLVLVLLSLASLIALYQRIQELHTEKPHVVPAWLLVIIVFVILIHILSVIILAGVLLFPEFIDIEALLRFSN